MHYSPKDGSIKKDSCPKSSGVRYLLQSYSTSKLLKKILKEDARVKTFVSSIILRREEKKCKKKFYQN